ncbi:MAG: efflux RND transporter permease subunit, partial [Clostridia bacterium]|nr:efflux RND transporter permease subunit [Clostridia bacterium]
MLSRISVKKPYTVIVGIILVIVLGVIAFGRMTTDMLPSMNFPYVIVYTTYIGATPEQIETEVTRPMESSFATLTDIKEIQSRSRDNLALVVLEFNSDADMNTALIEIDSEITTLQASWPDAVGAPAILKINPDLLPVSIVSVSREDMDILALSTYVNDTLIPRYESINGVAQVSASGLIQQEVDVTIEQDRIDVLNNAILRDVDAQLADVEEQLDNAQAQLSDGRSQLARQKSAILGQLNSALEQLDGGAEQMESALSELKAQRAQLAEQLEQVNGAIAQLESLPTLTENQKALLKQLQEQLGALEGQKEQLESRLEAIRDQQGTDRISGQREDAQARKAELTAERERLETYIQDLEKADASALNREIDKLTGELDQAQKAQAEAQSALSMRKSELSEAQALVAQLEREVRERSGQTETPAPTEAPAETAAPVVPTDTPAPAQSDAPATEAPQEAPTDAPSDELPNTSDTPAATAQPEAEAVWKPFFFASAEEKSVEELEQDLNNARSRVSALEEQVAEAEQLYAQSTAEANALSAELERKKQALDDLQEGDLTTRIEAARRELIRLDFRISALDAELQAIDEVGSGEGTVAAALLEQINALDEQINAIRNSDEYKGLALLTNEDERAAQYAQAVEGKAQLEAGIAQMDAAIEKLEQGVIPAGTIEGMDQDMTLDEARSMLASARRQAISAFAQAETQLKEAAEELAKARKEFEENRDEALKEAGLDGIITVQTVAGMLGAQNMNMPAGYVYDVNDDEYLVRVGDKFTSLEGLRKLKLFSLGLDSVDEIRLTDVARVELTDNSKDSFTKVDGLDGIMLSIEKQSTYSTTDVSDRVVAKNEELMAEIPGLHIVDMFNQGDYINIIVDSVLSNLVYGGLLAILVLMIFLLDWRPTAIVALSIPLSVVAAFVCMYFSGITLNVLSLSGLALGIGMLVDNSIVAIENIFRLHNEEKVPILHACVEGVNQVSGSLFASTLTTICVFLPVLFVSGMAHDLFLDLGLTITYSLLASLLAAMTVVPSMAAGIMKTNRMNRKNGLFHRFQQGYVRLLRGALRVKPLVLLASVALLAFSIWRIPSMGISFMPQVNSTQMSASLALDDEGDQNAQRQQALELMEDMMQIDGIETVGLTGGSGVSSLMGGGGSLTYYILVAENAGRSNADIARDIRASAEKRNMELSVETSTMDISMLTGSGISIDITGDDTDELSRIARDVADIVRSVPGATEVSDGLETAVPEMRVMVDKEAASEHNLTVAQVLQFLGGKLAGKTEITQATLDGAALSIYVIDGRNSTITPDTLQDLEIESVSGDESELVRIGDIAEIYEGEGFSTINRSNQKRIVSVSFQAADGVSANHLSDDVAEALSRYNAPEGYEIAFSGENETVMSIMQDLLFMVAVAVALIFLIMVAQFQSFRSPFIVMFTIPLAFTGGFIALLITGMDLSIVAMVGFLVLSGVIVNNGIVFVDTVNQLRIGGMRKRDALVEAGRLRLRPILMTALTTILGMSTMALGTGLGAEMMQPMAVVVIGGLTYATLMTLFVVPCMYDLLNG